MTHDKCDLLIVGGTDSSLPAAAQAARMGVGRIIVVNDIEWFGGQWSAAGLSMIDEMCMIRGRWGMYPRSGMHLELIRHVRDYNRQHFGVASPGNARAYQGTTPTGAATAFNRIVEPYLDGGTGQVRLVLNHRPVEVLKSNNTVTGVVFEDVNDPSRRMTVEARLTIDASDWGDVVSRSGANYFVGADPRSRFDEVGAPEIMTEERRTEVNSMNWCPVLVETGRDATIEKPASYDERLYFNSSPLTAKEFDDLAFTPETSRGRALPFVDTVSLGLHGTGAGQHLHAPQAHRSPPQQHPGRPRRHGDRATPAGLSAQQLPQAPRRRPRAKRTRCVKKDDSRNVLRAACLGVRGRQAVLPRLRLLPADDRSRAHGRLP
jgi:hypothetical protein